MLEFSEYAKEWVARNIPEDESLFRQPVLNLCEMLLQNNDNKFFQKRHKIARYFWKIVLDYFTDPLFY